MGNKEPAQIKYREDRLWIIYFLIALVVFLVFYSGFSKGDWSASASGLLVVILLFSIVGKIKKQSQIESMIAKTDPSQFGETKPKSSRQHLLQQFDNKVAAGFVISIPLLLAVTMLLVKIFSGRFQVPGEHILGFPPIRFLIGPAVVVALFSYWLLFNEKKKNLVYGLAAMNFLFAIVITWFVLPDINKQLSTESLRPIEYKMVSTKRWQAVDAPIPDIKVVNSKYWQQFGVGDTQVFNIRKGGLGLYQWNMKSVYEDQRRFYEPHDQSDGP
ncbi:MAG: hypothetical protein HKM24_06255 [Gammaproteobacteria bacterium]|nr:hypothetical protein [Gammaproteobacteria bacterium]